jgi:hypothetical protein
MSVITYLEQLATNAHHQVDPVTLASALPVAMQHAVLANHSADFKASLVKNTLPCDRSTVFLA